MNIPMNDKSNYKRFILEFGMGLDQHGQDPTRACTKAVKNAISDACLAGLLEIVRLRDVNDMLVEIQIACPYPDQVDRQAVLDAVPFGTKELTLTDGGMAVHGLFQPEIGDVTDEALVANACVIVWVNVEQMLDAWRPELVVSD
jgi:uncharacterized protein (TIGR02058 family)